MDFIPQNIEIDIAGKSNPSSLKKDFYYTDLKSVINIPPTDAGSNRISTAIGMRPAVAADPTATPPVVAVTAGKFARIATSEVDMDFKVERVGEVDNHAGFKVSVKMFINGKSPEASHNLSLLRNRRLILIVFEKDGTRYIIEDIILHYGSQVNPKRGYNLEGETILSEEPPVYTGPIVF